MNGGGGVLSLPSDMTFAFASTEALGFSGFLYRFLISFLSLGLWCHTDSVDLGDDVCARRPQSSIFLN